MKMNFKIRFHLVLLASILCLASSKEDFSIVDKPKFEVVPFCQAVIKSTITRVDEYFLTQRANFDEERYFKKTKKWWNLWGYFSDKYPHINFEQFSRHTKTAMREIRTKAPDFDEKTKASLNLEDSKRLYFVIIAAFQAIDRNKDFFLSYEEMTDFADICTRYILKSPNGKCETENAFITFDLSSIYYENGDIMKLISFTQEQLDLLYNHVMLN